MILIKKNLVFLLFSCFFFSCYFLKKERIIEESYSPDGLFLAYFTDKPCFDGPCHILYLQNKKTKKTTKLLEIADDSNWCSEISWLPNNREVAFLIMRKKLYIFNINDLKHHRIIDLIPGSENHGYPPNPAVYKFHFSSDGKSIYFKKDRIYISKKELNLNKKIISIPYESEK